MIRSNSGTQQNVSGETPRPDSESSCHAIAHIDSIEELLQPLHVHVLVSKEGEDRDRTDEGGKKVAAENKCSPNAGATGSLQKTVES